MFTLAVHRVEWFSAGVSSSQTGGVETGKPRELNVYIGCRCRLWAEIEVVHDMELNLSKPATKAIEF